MGCGWCLNPILVLSLSLSIADQLTWAKLSELGKAEHELGLGCTSIKTHCIEFIYKRYYWLV